MNALDQCAELIETIRQLSHNLRDHSKHIVEHSGALLDYALGPLNTEQKDAIVHIHRSAQNLSSISNDIDQIFSLDYKQPGARSEEAKSDDKSFYLLDYSAIVANESRSPVASIRGFSDFLYN